MGWPPPASSRATAARRWVGWTRSCGGPGGSLRPTTWCSIPDSTRTSPPTAVWGSQQTGLFEGATVDGVFALWYGKGPGVDRSLDVLKHANAAGTAPAGGVLLLAGDDHAAARRPPRTSPSTVFMAAMMPVLNPAGVQEFLDFGLLRLGDVAVVGPLGGDDGAARDGREFGASSTSSLGRPVTSSPRTSTCRSAGWASAGPTTPLDQEARLHATTSCAAALAFARANHLDRVDRSTAARRGSASSPPARRTLDVRQALDDLGIDAGQCRRARPARSTRSACPGRSQRRHPRFRQRPGRDPGGRGEAPDHRGRRVAQQLYNCADVQPAG